MIYGGVLKFVEKILWQKERTKEKYNIKCIIYLYILIIYIIY